MHADAPTTPRYDDTVDPRHQAQRGHPGRLLAARRGPRRAGTTSARRYARAAAERDVDEPTAYFLAQTLLGAWPLDAERLADYLVKAVREAKQHTTLERSRTRHMRHASLALARQCLASRSPTPRHRRRRERRCHPGHHLGDEAAPAHPARRSGQSTRAASWSSLALVDPDNRRPVDYARSAAAMLARSTTAEPHAAMARGLSEEKLWVTSRALRLRGDRPRLFDADGDLPARWSARPPLLGFLRGGRVATVVTRWPGRLARTGWGDATVDLPAGAWPDVLTDAGTIVGDARHPAEPTSSPCCRSPCCCGADHEVPRLGAATPSPRSRCCSTEVAHPMDRGDGGWWHARVQEATPGATYFYRLDDGEPRSRPAGAVAAGRPRGAVEVLDLRPARGRDRPLARPAAAGIGDLRAARRNVHRRGHARRRDRPARPSRRAGHRHRRGHAARDLPGSVRLGVRRRRALRRP